MPFIDLTSFKERETDDGSLLLTEKSLLVGVAAAGPAEGSWAGLGSKMSKASDGTALSVKSSSL